MRDEEQGNGGENTDAVSDGSDAVVFDHYDWSGDDSPSIAVAEAVAAVTNRSVTTLPPVQEVVDADALDMLVRSGDPLGVRVSIDYAGTDVTVTGDGRIRVKPRE
ncbi:HalOD1 output domain-containing protein [Halosimplex halophilum]|uniref:HalOD1 output domain-containing protein n=1 Tax=Halosimplex halophilum TaxID=2559572 RepID=UPI00107FCF99|nr:HalOD1 output domain-containing protein [Halosimplex halophilum]